jgi:hypothetical protein
MKIGKLLRQMLMLLIITFISSPVQGQNLSSFKTYTNSHIENLDLYKLGNVYQKDLLLYLDLIKETHPAFAQNTFLSLNIDSLRITGYEWAANCKSVKDFASYIQSITSLLNDGHTTLTLNYDKNLIYPFTFFKDGKSIYLDGINKEHNHFLGKQISKINGQPVLDVINIFKIDISSDNEIYFMDKVKNFMQIYSMWENKICALPDSSLQFTFTDNTSLFLYPVSQKQIDLVRLGNQIPSNTIREITRQPFLYKLVPEKSICYLQFNQCVDQTTLRLQYLNGTDNVPEQLEEKIKQFPRFDTFLSEMFEVIREKKIETLVIDVRDNSGGHSGLCNILLSWLMPVKNLKFGESFIRFSDLWKQHYTALSEQYRDVLYQNKLSMKTDTLYSNMWLSNLLQYQNLSSSSNGDDGDFKLNRNESSVFKGNVIFIQNEKTFSSAGLLIVNAHDNNIGTLIGTKSSYKPCSYGDILGWKLPNTETTGYVSHKIFKRPDSNKCEISFLSPDIELSLDWSTFQKGKDTCLEWVLEKY